MKHVDALSRHHNILIIEESSFEQTLALRQSFDEKINEVKDKLQENELPLYELRNGVVYRKDNKGKLLFYVPSSMIDNTIRTCHDDVGHVGIDKVCNLITNSYWFPNLKEKVKDYISRCLKCIVYSPVSGKPEGQLHCLPKGNKPFHTLHIQ